MTDHVQPLERFSLARKAQESIENWSTGAQFLTLLTALHEQGWMNFLAEPRGLDALADFSGFPPTRLKDVLAVLEAHGVVEQQGGGVRLSPPFEALVADDAWVTLSDVLDRATMMSRLVGTAVEERGVVPPLSETDALVIARAFGGRTTRVAEGLYAQLLAELPEVIEAIRNGRWLDVGCGVGGATLTLATMFPEMRAVAIELVPTVAAETVRRAEALGVADRVDIRCVDARDFDEQDAFVGAFWAQPFFPEPARAATLDMIRRALKPGALLMVQEMEREPQDAGQAAYALRRLVYQGWDVPFGRPAEQLAAEAQSAGFELARLVATGFGRIVLLRRPAAPA